MSKRSLPASRRVFLQPRLASAAGYQCPPTVTEAMTFYLPAFEVRSRRIVCIDSQIWEIWSPNSTACPFYPGLRDLSVDLEKDLPADRRRCDGHLGRFDPTVSPQYFEPERPWLGFIRRSVDESRPEDVPWLKEWQPTRAPNLGTIRPTYVKRLRERANDLRRRFEKWKVLAKTHPRSWECRPSCPDDAQFDELFLTLSFDRVVDLVTKTQRAIKYVCAWFKYADALLKEDKNKPNELKSVEGADETLMGSWINGCDEKDGVFLLRYRVPCFMIHVVDGLHEWDRITSYDPHYYSFATGTIVAGLVASNNPFDMAVKLDEGNGQVIPDVTNDLAVLPAKGVPIPMFADRIRSSPVVQGYDGTKYEDPRAKPPTVSSTNTASIPRQYHEEEGVIIPPPVEDLVPKGSWTSWMTSYENEQDCFIKMGKKDEARGTTFYDRKSKRKLILEDRPTIPYNYHADPDVFGQPVPNWPFFERIHTNLKLVRASEWMYRQEKPAKGTVGKTFAPGNPEPPPAAESSKQVWRNTGSESPPFLPVGRSGTSNNPQVAPSASIPPLPTTLELTLPRDPQEEEMDITVLYLRFPLSLTLLLCGDDHAR
ncbi:hypothetical protein CVT26_007519 [Gymnopilus dilepis]|uniref:Uncharacterized protein n=1 Tax=Gymnopilus dilepis TaxID=231916 RepID=A0A409YSP3_9AGAR|nr:hypothetical protein CVT26_007519 [Gymnopilus dilepis]